jgi:hypothetical protein
MSTTKPLKLIEIASATGSEGRFFAKVPDGMSVDDALALVNAIIKRANHIYSSSNGDHDIGAVYDTIARDLAAAEFMVEARLEVRASVVWDRPGQLSDGEQRLISDLDARHGAAEAEAGGANV